MSKWEIVGNNMLVNDDFKNDAALLLSGDWNSEEEMQNFLTDVCNKLNGYAEIKSEESIGNEPYRKPSEEEKIIDNLKRRITELEAKNEKLGAMKITPEMVREAFDYTDALVRSEKIEIRQYENVCANKLNELMEEK